MMNFLLLVILPMIFVGVLVAIFMYCCHYLLRYAKDSITQMNDKNEETPEAPAES